MDKKKLLRIFLYPHFAVMTVLLFVSTAFLIYSMVFLGTESVAAIISYVLAFYTLTVFCLRIPQIIRFCKTLKQNNGLLRRWSEDAGFRVNVSLYGSLIFNTAYAVFQLGLGYWNHTFWYYSLSGYYLALAVMRFFLVRYTRRHTAGEMIAEELKKYRACGIVFLVMNLSIALIIFFMVYWNRTFVHHEITTIAQAAYTFTSLTLAIVSVFKYRKYKSPVYSASKMISLASACVSILTLETTMLTTFGGEMELLTRRLFLGLSGGGVSVFIIVMAVYMIASGTKKLKIMKADQLQGKYKINEQ